MTMDGVPPGASVPPKPRRDHATVHDVGPVASDFTRAEISRVVVEPASATAMRTPSSAHDGSSARAWDRREERAAGRHDGGDEGEARTKRHPPSRSFIV